jgi:hypothetical protein
MFVQDAAAEREPPAPEQQLQPRKSLFENQRGHLRD